MKRIIFVLFLFILVGCSSEFEKSMRSGKDALKAGEYEQAIKHFKEALIEEPRDEDAIILIKQAESMWQASLAAEKVNDYESEISSLVDQFLEIYNQYDESYLDDPSKVIRIADFRNSEKLIEINSKISAIGIKYSEFNDIKEMNENLTNAIEILIDFINKEDVGVTNSYIFIKYHLQGYYDKLNELLDISKRR